MKHRWIAVLFILFVALGIAFLFTKQMEKVNGGSAGAAVPQAQSVVNTLNQKTGGLGTAG